MDATHVAGNGAGTPELEPNQQFRIFAKQLTIQALTIRWLQSLAREIDRGELRIDDVVKPSELGSLAIRERSFVQGLGSLEDLLQATAALVREHESAVLSGNQSSIRVLEEQFGKAALTFPFQLTEPYFRELLTGIRSLDSVLESDKFDLDRYLVICQELQIGARFADVTAKFFASRSEPLALSLNAALDPKIDLGHEVAQAQERALASGLTPYQELIRGRIEASRRELIDTSLRNPLLDIPSSRSKGVDIFDEKSSEIYRILVREKKRMYFAARAAENNSDPDELPQPADGSLAAKYTDNILQTNHSSTNLQSRLVKSQRDAESDLRDDGANTLFLTLGTLRWYDQETDQERQSPLITIPVKLERTGANSRFYVEAIEEDLTENLALKQRFRESFGIELPDMPDSESLNLEDYFQSIRASIQSHPRFSLETDDIRIAFFSFARYLMFNDLAQERWDDSNKLWDNPAIQDLLGRGVIGRPRRVPPGTNIDDLAAPSETAQVLDCDSSQRQAVLDVRHGSGITVIKGPPGTGKSQTITNLIATAIGDGKKVLFVSEKLRALEVVHNSL
ncbi:MAG: DUF4011 domain-containing protein, partial [Bdellovibrionales bacterium]|nr:DUF4011 domain-containing protein [Bdellovibrionales bacterium]